MRIFPRLALFACTLAWCTNGWCEVNNLDPGVINDWMRSAVMSDSDDTEIKRVLQSTTMSDWTESWTSRIVKYEVNRTDCNRTLTIFSTDEYDETWKLDWAKRIEKDQERVSKQLKDPKVIVRTYRPAELNQIVKSPIMDLSVEYQVLDGMPVLTVSDQREVKRVVSAFKTAEYARIRVIALGNQFTFQLNLEGFADKVSWSDEHCPLEVDPEVPKSPGSS